MAVETKISSIIDYECPMFRVEKAVVQFPDGSRADHYYVLMVGASFVVPVDKDGNILLIREWRSAAEKYVWRIPAGKRDSENEDFLETAHRELREEIGMDAGLFEKINEVIPPSSWLKDPRHFYAAYDLFPSPLDTGDEYERPEIHPTSPNRIMEMIEAEEITGDIAAVLRKFITKQMKER